MHVRFIDESKSGPVGSKNAAEPPGRSHLCCPSADCPPGGARVHCSAGHAPSCSEPETMSLTQRQCHKYGTVLNLLCQSHTMLVYRRSRPTTKVHLRAD
uniref:Uncharacterized protein n=1 Tax=Hippocampus comes TaxID=109280 RepID=A0A3Q2YIE9_HIPCM